MQAHDSRMIWMQAHKEDAPMKTLRTLCTAASIAAFAAPMLGAQTPANDPTARLEQVLPADVAARVIATIAAARSHDLPAAALENRALKFAAKGVAPDSIEKSVNEQAARMAKAKNALQNARGTKPSGDEVDAAAEVMRKGVDGSKVSALAKSTPSGRSLAVPLFVIGSLMDRGLPSDAALARVQAKLAAHAADSDLEKMPNDLPAQAIAGQGHKPAETGQALAPAKSDGHAGGSGSATAGPPSGVPANGGKPATPPGLANRPTIPGRKP
jgi:hypothetical protein